MATITAAAGGGNWNVGSTWVGGVVPLTSDSVNLDATSGSVTITATAQCNNINFTGYTNTITFNANLTITGNLLRSSSVFTYAGTGAIIIGGTTTQSVTTANTNWDVPITIGAASPQVNLLDTFKINALLTLSSTTSPVITRNNIFDPAQEIQAFGNIVASSTGIYTGSAAIKVTGSANQAFTGSGNYQIRNDFTIDKSAGVFTISGIFSYNTGTLTYVASGGTVNTTTSNFIIGTSTTLNTNGINWNNVTLNSGTITLTLTSDFNIAGTFSATGLGGALTLTFSGAGLFNPTGDFVTNNSSASGIATITITLPNDISVSTFTYTDNSGSANRRNVTLNGSRNITVNGAVYFGNTRTSTISGTCTIIFVGNANFTIGTLGGAFAGVYSIRIKIDNGLNTCTFVGSPVFTSTTITYTSGTTTGASCFFSACTLNLNAGGQWGTDVTIIGATTLTSNATFGNLTTATTAVSFTGAFTVNVEGNLAINIATSGASTPIVINGTGNQSWTHGSAVYLSNNLTINKPSGTLTLGANVYYATGTLTHTLGDVDVITNSNTFQTVNATINTSNITWNNFFFASSGANTMTLANNLYISNTFTCGGSGTISGAFNIYCGNCNINNSSSGASVTTITYSGIIYCSNNLTFSGASNTASITGTVYVGGSVFFNAPASSSQGAGNIYMVGNGVISSLNIIYPINTNLYFDTGGKITISTPINFANGAARTINLIRGNVDASKCDLYLNQNVNHTLINMHKIAWKSVNVAGTATILTMNEFFSGKPNLKTIVASSVASNYTVTFTDNFEKIAKFVTITNCTLSRPQQLLVITDSKKSSTNTRGIRYINSLPNGISKGDPSIQNILTPGQSSNLLIGDPAFVKSI
jgi:hypothetical protein